MLPLHVQPYDFLLRVIYMQMMVGYVWMHFVGVHKNSTNPYYVCNWRIGFHIFNAEDWTLIKHVTEYSTFIFETCLALKFMIIVFFWCCHAYFTPPSQGSFLWNLPLCKQLSFYFLVLWNRNISLGTWEHIKLGELTQHNALGFFCWGEIPQNTHRNQKGVVQDILELSVKSPSFSPPISSAFATIPSFSCICKVGNFIKSGYEILKLNI